MGCLDSGGQDHPSGNPEDTLILQVGVVAAAEEVVVVDDRDLTETAVDDVWEKLWRESEEEDCSNWLRETEEGIPMS